MRIVNVFRMDATAMTMPPTTTDAAEVKANTRAPVESILADAPRRAEIDWSLRDRFSLLCHSPAIAEGIYGSIALGWGYQIFMFDHAHDVIADAMTQLVDFLPAWGFLASGIGTMQLLGALFRIWKMRVWAIRANFLFMLFAWVSMARSHTWTPGIIIIPVGYLLWMFITYCSLLNNRNDTK